MSLYSLYDGSEEMEEYFNTPLKIVNQELQKWNTVIENHLFRINGLSEVLRLPSFDQSLEWVNTNRPLSVDIDLKGKIVIMDFFTYCCINCEHILPYLKAVEDEFAGNASVVIVGVHSPKFPNEKDKNNVRDAVFRNSITHPVLHDPENFLWKKMGIYCWPTVIILSPAHVVQFSIFGESQIDKLSHLVHQTLKFFESQKLALNYESLSSALQVENILSEVLRYPSNITVCDEYVVVSDTGHNRLIIITLQGIIMDVIGNEKAGFEDGSFSKALFNSPRGTTWLKPNIIFVADTGNHSIRQIDLLSKTVTTVFDDRAENCNSFREMGDTAPQHKFLSPWDLCLGPEFGADTELLNTLYIAVAGSHQIWALSLVNLGSSDKQYVPAKCLPFAGSGNEECRNNSYKMKAGFAQPSGISYSGAYPGYLFIADSESSSIRSISLVNGAVKTLVGGDLDPEYLFQFGDADGKGLNVKLQHPLSLCAVNEEKIYVADTYNHKIKVVNSKTRECSTLNLHQDSTHGSNILNSESFFHEPSGLCYIEKDNTLLVSDTNKHCLKLIDLKTNIIKKIDISQPLDCVDSSSGVHLQENASSAKTNSTSINLYPTSRRNLKNEPIQVYLNVDGEIHFKFLVTTKGISLTQDSLQQWDISFPGECQWKVVCSGGLFQEDIQPSLIIKCLANQESCTSEVELNINVTACDDKKKTCFATSTQIMLKTAISKSGNNIFSVNVLL